MNKVKTIKIDEMTISKWAYSNRATTFTLEKVGITELHTFNQKIFELICDQTCIKRNQLLEHLYRVTGQVLSKGNQADIEMLKALVHLANDNQQTLIQNWVTRSKIILKDMKKYDYLDWCEGRFSQQDLMING